MKRTALALAAMLSIVLLTAPAAWSAKPTVTVAFIEENQSIATSYMFKYIMEEKVGVQVNLVRTTVEDMWKGIAEGKYDASLSADTSTQKAYFNQYRKEIEDLGPNWIEEKKTVHTIAKKGFQQKRPAMTTFLKNFCLCGGKLEDAMGFIEGGQITKKAGLAWIKKHEDWVDNMMGLCKDVRMEDWG